MQEPGERGRLSATEWQQLNCQSCSSIDVATCTQSWAPGSFGPRIVCLSLDSPRKPVISWHGP